MRTNPGDSRSARIIVDSYLQQKNPAEAFKRLSEIAAEQPKSASLQSMLGEWQMSAGKLGEARNAFEAAKAADPNLHSADLALAEIDRRQNRPDAARKRLMEVAAADPKNVPVLVELAAMEEGAGNSSGAIARYRSILAVDSSNLFALNNLANALATQNPDEALKFAQQAAEAAPDNAAVQDTLGWIYYRKGLYSEAVTYLKTAVSKEPSPRRRYHLAMSYLKTGEQEAGRDLLRAALQADPNLPKTEGALEVR
jgi:predicted Zn-dependent protease